MSDLLRRYAVLRPTERMIAWTFVVFPVGLGGVLLLGGPARVANPTFEALRESPGGVPMWGAMWLFLGLMLGFADLLHLNDPRRHLFKMIGYIAVATVSFMFAFTFLLNAISNPTGGLTGVPAYIGYGMLSASIASSHFVLWRLKIQEPVTR